MNPTRRDLLRASAAAPLLLGLQACARRPAWFDAALRRIRAEGGRGLVIRLPKESGQRCALAHALAEWRPPSVVICLESECVDGWLVGAREGDGLLRIDADGQVLEGHPLDLAEFLSVRASITAPTALPYGVSLVPGPTCGENAACVYDPCLECGRGGALPRARRFLKFLAK